MSLTNKFYLTKEGAVKLEQEFNQLKALRKKMVEKDTPAALHSEELEIEFVAFRDDLDFLDARLEELDHILRNFELIVPPPKNQQDKVGLGAKVEVEVDGQKDEFLLVGTLEADPDLGHISNESPLGKALIGKKAGDVVALNALPALIYKIIKVSY